MTESVNKLRIDPDIVWRMLDENAIVVSARDGEVRVLNQVGTAIWQLLVEETDLATIEQYLTNHFDVEQARAHDDLLTFLEALSERGILR
jgi:hypothetical protein